MSITPIRINTKEMRVVKASSLTTIETPISSVISSVIRGEYDSLPPNVTTRKEKQKSVEPITSAFVRPQQKIKSSVACAASVETAYETFDDYDDRESDYEFSSDSNSTPTDSDSDSQISDEINNEINNESVDDLNSQLQKLGVSNDQMWELSLTQKGKDKLCSNGYYYNLTNPNKSEKLRWRCEQYRAPSVVKNTGCGTCPGTGESNGLKPPVTLKNTHTHMPVFARQNQLKKNSVRISEKILKFF